MINNKLLLRIIILASVFVTLFSFSVSLADDDANEPPLSGATDLGGNVENETAGSSDDVSEPPLSGATDLGGNVETETTGSSDDASIPTLSGTTNLTGNVTTGTTQSTEDSVKELKERLKAQQAGALEMTISELCLAVGDHFLEYTNFLLKEEVTVEKIIYNQVTSLNANFFDKSVNPSKASASAFIKDIVNNWYSFLRKIVIVIYLVALVAVGVMIMLGGAGRRADARDILTKWTIGVAILFLFPYVMRYAFDVNEAILKMISGDSSTASIGLGNSFGGSASTLTKDDIEERSPLYVGRSSYLLTFGSEEATVAYLNNVDTYTKKADLMRIMRAMAGVTGRMLFVILWYVMLWQLIVFIFVYLKRYLMIAFLIIIFPITLVEYVIGTITTGKQSALSSWCKEFFVNVFLQSIHAVVYGIVASVIIEQIRATLSDGLLANINWIIFIVATNFVFAGEKIIRDIINAAGTESVKPAGDVGKGMRGGIKGGFDKMKKGFKK